MNRTVLFLVLLAFSTPTWGQAGSDDDGQLEAAKKAGDAAKLAVKSAQTKKKSGKKPTKVKATGISLGTLNWEAAAKSKQTKSAIPGHNLTANWDAALSPVAQVGYPWIEHHGAYRLRTSLFLNYDLDTYQGASQQGSSPFAPPLTEIDQQGNQHPESTNHRFDRDGESQSSANMRLRYKPTIHISDSIRIRASMDILDNMVLGSTPDGGPNAQRSLGADADVLGRDDIPLQILEDSQRPPESGVNGWRDSVRVKRVWGEWKTTLGMLAVGRMPSHWGLGLIANSGDCLDCDFGDSVDRLMGVAKLADTYLALAWDFPNEGMTGFSGSQTYRNQPSGQAYDLDQRDDVNQFVVSIFRQPLSRDEIEARNKTLNDEHKPVFDWGVYNRIRTQSLESGYGRNLTPPEGGQDAQLYEVDAFTYTPDLWLSFEYRPEKDIRYQVQFEGAATFGSIKEVPQLYGEPREECVDPTETDLEVCEKTLRRSRDIRRYGYALQFDAQNKDVFWGIHHGLASGDSSGSFGVVNGSEIKTVLPSGEKDETLTAFQFNRDYQVDLIMFRQMLGAVTNAAYFKPYIRYHFIDEPSEAWGFQLATVYGHALEKEATPGKENALGLELDLELFVEEFDRFRWSLAYGAFLPMGAFNVVDQDGKILAEPSAAQTFQMTFSFIF